MFTLITKTEIVKQVAENRYVSFQRQLPIISATGKAFNGLNLACGSCRQIVSHEAMFGKVTEVLSDVLLLSGVFQCPYCQQSHAFEFRVRFSSSGEASVEFVHEDGDFIQVSSERQTGLIGRAWLALVRFFSELVRK